MLIDFACRFIGWELSLTGSLVKFIIQDNCLLSEFMALVYNP